MALPRTALLGIVGAVLILATFVVTHGLGKKNDSASPTPVQASAPKTATKSTPTKHAATTTKSSAHGGRGIARHTSPVKTKTATKPAAKPATPNTGASLGLPLKVAQALAERRVIVLYFGANGADDTLTAASVRELKSSAGSGVTVFMDKLSNLADYRRVVEGLDVSQAPSIVIVDRSRKAQLLEGYIDAGSLRQAVADVTQ
jgi:hypothetical protein